MPVKVAMIKKQLPCGEGPSLKKSKFCLYFKSTCTSPTQSNSTHLLIFNEVRETLINHNDSFLNQVRITLATCELMNGCLRLFLFQQNLWNSLFMKKTQKKSWAWRSLYIWYKIMLIYINFKFNFLTFIYFKLWKNTNVRIKTFHKPFTPYAYVLYRI